MAADVSDAVQEILDFARYKLDRAEPADRPVVRHCQTHVGRVTISLELPDGHDPPSSELVDVADNDTADRTPALQTARPQPRGRGRPASTCVADIFKLMCDGRPRNKSQIIRGLAERGKEHSETSVRNALAYLSDPARPALYYDGQFYRMPD